MTTQELLNRAISAKKSIGLLSTQKKADALCAMAHSLLCHENSILQANELDLVQAKNTVSSVMLDRLTLTSGRLKDMADGIVSVSKLPDPCGVVLENRILSSGIELTKLSTSIGVIGMIYESRPNVTSDAAALCFMSGNVCVLRGGKEAIHTNQAIVVALKEGLSKVGISPDAIGLVEDTSRQSSLEMMEAIGKIDLLIPRGSAGLIRACIENSKVPCIQTGSGICHIYVDENADIEQSLNVINNAKTSRPSVCNAAEVCLVHAAIAPTFLPRLKEILQDQRIAQGKTPVELRLDAKAAQLISGTLAQTPDFDTEFLDYILAVKIVNSVEEAIQHISEHSTGHSECIMTSSDENANLFAASIDSAAVYINASTRFTDGGEFGFGCEIGISTQKMHARGPMGLQALTTYKYILRGNGQTR